MVGSPDMPLRATRAPPRRPAGSRRLRDRAVSDVMGNVMMTGVTTILMGGAFALFMAVPGPEDQVHADVAAILDPGADGLWDTGDERIGLRHLGGERLDAGAVRISVRVDGVTTTYEGEALGSAFADGGLSLGETWIRTMRVAQASDVSLGVTGGGAIVAAAKPDVGTRLPTLQVPGMPVLTGQAGLNSVALTWTTPVPGGAPITGYRLYRVEQAGGPGNAGLVPLASVGATNAYLDTSVIPAVTYNYWVSAVNVHGEGERSKPLTIRALTGVPGSPVLTAVAGNLNVTLTWTRPADGGSPITGYKVYGGPSLGAGLMAVVGPVTSYVAVSLPAGAPHYFRVTAVNDAGEGAPSTEVSATPLALPAAPATLAAAHDGGATSGRIKLTWSAPLLDGGAPVTGYKVYRGASPTAITTLAATTGSVLTFTDTGLTPRVVYYYQVAAVTAAGEGPRSVVAFATG